MLVVLVFMVQLRFTKNGKARGLLEHHFTKFYWGVLELSTFQVQHCTVRLWKILDTISVILSQDTTSKKYDLIVLK